MEQDAISLAGRAALVTGAGRGIGRAVALKFVEHGARVMVNDVDPAAARETAQLCQDAGGDGAAAALGGSIISPGFAEELARATAAAFGRLDILVNNAGITRDAMAHKMRDEDWDLVLDVNLSGTFRCIRACAPYLRGAAKEETETFGEPAYHRKVVNFCSSAMLHGNAGQANYVAAKMGNLGITRVIAREWAPYRVNVNAITPGFTDTRLTQERERSPAGLGIPAAARRSLLERAPFGRAATPEEIARVVLFLASPLSDWITGQHINASGGQQIP